MPFVHPVDMQAALLSPDPTITVWNRIEGWPRTGNFERALKAEVRDAAWMLAQQYRLGETLAGDGGSPVSARLMVEQTRLTKYQPHDAPVEKFDTSVPFEATAERRPIPLTLPIRAAMGRQWLKMIQPLGNYASSYKAEYPFRAPDPASQDDATLTAHPEVWQAFAAAAGRLMDGGALYQYLLDPLHRASDNVVSGTEQAAVDAAGVRFMAWVARLFVQPAADDAWDASRLEYRFACSAPERNGESVLTASEHHGGHLDWPSFEFREAPAALAAVDAAPAAEEVVKTEIRGLIPSQVSFAGMPNTRWWAFEDGRTNFGDIRPGTTDIAKLLVMEFALVYANDWFLIPCEVPVGSLMRVRGLAVTNVFGERTWIEAAGRGSNDDWSRWSMYSINREGKKGQPADMGLLMLPTTPKSQRSAPFEDVYMFRDDVASMVWGVEEIIQTAAGQPKDGAAAGHELRAWFDRQGTPAAPNPPAAPIAFELMNTATPENWIPFLPVQVSVTPQADSRDVQLQRAAMPRLVPDQPLPMKIEPRTALLREGLDRGQTYFVHEEQVPRAGTALQQTFQRTRWFGGRTYVWASVKRQSGKGEGSSGLEFDQIVSTGAPHDG